MLKGARTAWLMATLFVLVAALLLGLWLWCSPKGTEGIKQIEIVLKHPDACERYSLQTDAEFLKEAAGEVMTLEGEETPHGFAVYAINGIEADFRTSGAYWAIYANGEYGEYSVDRQPIEDGASYGFFYETY